MVRAIDQFMNNGLPLWEDRVEQMKKLSISKIIDGKPILLQKLEHLQVEEGECKTHLHFAIVLVFSTNNGFVNSIFIILIKDLSSPIIINLPLIVDIDNRLLLQRSRSSYLGDMKEVRVTILLDVVGHVLEVASDFEALVNICKDFHAFFIDGVENVVVVPHHSCDVGATLNFWMQNHLGDDVQKLFCERFVDTTLVSS